MVDTLRPGSLKEALVFRKERGAVPFAGGTDLMVRRKNWTGLSPVFESPVLFLDQIPELLGVEVKDGLLIIGAAVTLSEIQQDSRVPKVLKEACASIAAPSIRNRATLAGNICNASPAGDSLPALYILNTAVNLVSLTGERVLGIDEFITGPGRTEIREDEIVKSIMVPLSPYGTTVFRKVGTRKANALSKVSFAGLSGIQGGVIKTLRVAFGAVGPTVVRSRAIEEELEGTPLKDLSVSNVLSAYEKIIKPINDQRSKAKYRKKTALRLLEDFLIRQIDT